MAIRFTRLTGLYWGGCVAAMLLVQPVYSAPASTLPITQSEEFHHNYDAAILAARVPEPRPEDVATPEGLVRAFHASVSGPKGSWDDSRLRSLLLPTTSFVFPAHGAVHVVYPEDGFKEAKAVHAAHAWHERVDHIVILRAGRRSDLPHRDLAVAVYHQTGWLDHDKPIEEGRNICEMVFDGKRWWIVSDMW